MGDVTATTSNWRTWGYRLLMALFIGTAAVWTVFVGLRLHAMNDLQKQVAVLSVEHERIQREYVALEKETSGRLNRLEEYLYGDVYDKINKKPPPNKIEAYIQNNLNEFRKSKERVERRLFELETLVERWRREHGER